MMKEQLIAEIQRKMLDSLNNEQLMRLGIVLEDAFRGVFISEEETQNKQEELDATEVFIAAKRIEGCSEKTLSYYKKTIESMLTGIGKRPDVYKRQLHRWYGSA